MKGRVFKTVPYNVVLLGIVSFFTDVSSDMIMPILPLYIMALGGSAVAVGLIAGLGDSVASLLKVFAGYWSDRQGKRTRFLFAGYGLSATTKLLLALSTFWPHVLALRALERTGKGIRTAPRDALIAYEKGRGKVFGFHRTMDTAGAVLGASLAFVFLWAFALGLRTIVLLAAIPGFMALLPLLLVRERARALGPGSNRPCFVKHISELPRPLYKFIFIATVFAFGNFTYMFFILRASVSLVGLQNALALTVLLYVFFNVFYAIFAYPAGLLGDKLGLARVLLGGYALFGVVCLGFARFDSLPVAALPALMSLFACYGIFYALTNGNQRAYIAKLAPSHVKGTAMGLFHTSVGIASLGGSVVAGLLWQYISPSAPFLMGAMISIVVVVLFIGLRDRDVVMPCDKTILGRCS